jgi:glycosyltransferase involved in cell wall biosynthesis
MAHSLKSIIRPAAPKSQRPVADAALADSGVPVVMQLLSNLESGPLQRSVLDVTAGLIDAGWKTIVVSAGGPLVRELEKAGTTHVKLPVDTDGMFSIRRNVGRLAEVIAKYKVDIVHARERGPAWSGYYAAQKPGAAFVTTLHGTYDATTRRERTYSAIMARGARVIASSEFIAWHVVAEFEADPKRVRIVTPAVDFVNYDPRHVGAGRLISQSQQWRLPDGVPIVMLPGRLTRWKGESFLIHALAKIKRRDACCLLIGSDRGRQHYGADLEKLVKSHGLEGNLRTVDHCRDMPAAFMLADVVVSASIDPEAFGSVVAEAQAMGRPVIAPDHGGAQDIVISGETGWLVPPNDPDALARAINEALALTAAEREALSTRAIQHVRTHFTRERMCAETLSVYHEVLSERAAATPAW